MDLGIEGKRAAVAAASAGLGLGSARALVAEGARVAICGRNDGTIRAAAEALGGGCIPIVADVGGEAGARGFVRDAKAALGGVDILVANAGGPPPGTFASTEMDAYRHALELNCLSTIAMCQEAVPAMCEAGWGRVVAITSIGVREPVPSLIASVAARTGLTGFLKVLAREVAPNGVTVNSAQPGLHWTKRLIDLGASRETMAGAIPAGDVGDPDDFGRIVAFLCSETAKFVTGTGLLVDGGQSMGQP